MRCTIRELWFICVIASLIFVYKLIDANHVRTTICSGWRRPAPALENSTLEQQSFTNSQQKPRLEWGNLPVPETKILSHLAGMTMFDHLYLMNGTYFIVTDNPESVPPARMFTSLGLPLSASGDNNEPTEDTIKVIGVKEASLLFGPSASRFDGVTFMQTDPSQFLHHFYHFVIEIVAHVHWRIYSTLDPDITASGSTSLPFPRRLFLPNSDSVSWQDRAGLSLFFLRAAFPGISLHFQPEFEELASLRRPFVFDRIVIGDRAAWHRSANIKDPNYVYPLSISEHWWAPVRQSVVEFSAGTRNVTWGQGDGENPLILYISRQKTGRRLLKEDHEELVRELNNLNQNYGYEFVEAYMEDLSKVDQIYLTSRATILLGVHGNGLSAAAYMKPNPRSAVIEIFYPPGFGWDYHYTSWSFGIRHYGIWKDKYFTKPEVPKLAFPEGFHSAIIPVDGKAVAQLIHQRLSVIVND